MTQTASVAPATPPQGPAPTTGPAGAGIEGARAALAHGDHAGALSGAAAVLAQDAGHRDALLIAASARRHMQDTEGALAMLARLSALYPQFSLMLQERGLCHVARRDAPAAIADLLATVTINPALPHAWKMLEGLWRMTGDAANAALAAEHAATLRTLPPEVIHATSLFADGDLDAAEALIRPFLLTRGDHPEAMRLLAKIGLAHDVLDDAELLYAGVLTLAPDHHAARGEYVETLLKRHRYAAAREALAPLLESAAAHAGHRQQAATIAVGLGEHDAAIAIYRALLAETPAEDTVRAADINLWLGHALKTVGAVPDAIAAYREATRLRPDFGDAWWSLANLKTFRFTEADIAAMEVAPASGADRVALDFALGKALEDRGHADAAWARYAAGNAGQRAASRYRPEIIETNTRLQQPVCTPAFFAARADWGAPDPTPIFVLGLPRAGSTLIEQILASHPAVEGTQELAEIHRIAGDLQGRDHDEANPRYPGALADLTRDEVRALGERYLAETAPHRALGRPFFIDKMPNNFRHIGLIRLILPNAKIIDARRNPMDCCFSNLKQLFAQGQEFTYSAEDIARYYRTYLDLMRHWDAVLPGHVLRVTNEDVIDDLEGQVRRLLAHCGLSFDPACLDFHRNARAVRTPSSEQVRRPVNRDGQGAWRAFAAHLGPLEAALGDALTTWRD